MENRKYEMTNITMEFEGRVLHRIRALKDFSDCAGRHQLHSGER